MIKLFEAFAGYGSQSLAFNRTKIPYNVVGISEIDKTAIKAYYALHDSSIPNFGDIAKINPQNLPNFDLFTYSFPCQDIAPQGLQKGLIKGITRSGLLYECEKIIENKKPKYLLMENVKNLINKRFKPHFDQWLLYLESLGYCNSWFILNACDFGIPQNRERIFCISILNDKKNININTNKNNSTIFDFIDYNDTNYIGTTENQNGIGAFRGRKNEKGVYIQKLEMRKDKNSNTLTTVAKDNVIVLDGKYRYLNGNECLKLMGLNQSEISKLTSIKLSEAQKRKLSGNSIVIPVLQAIYEATFNSKESE